MNTAYYQGNRERLYAMMQPGSLLMLFSGDEIRKTNDEYYPFFADRSFVYFTGLKCRQAVLLALKDAEGRTCASSARWKRIFPLWRTAETTEPCISTSTASPPLTLTARRTAGET